MLESQPDLATQLRRVRGGYLKIQGQFYLFVFVVPTHCLMTISRHLVSLRGRVASSQKVNSLFFNSEVILSPPAKSIIIIIFAHIPSLLQSRLAHSS